MSRIGEVKNNSTYLTYIYALQNNFIIFNLHLFLELFQLSSPRVKR
jgi:hypothetical protein